MNMPADTKSVRQMLWRSMRIHLVFTIPDLMRTIPEGTTVKYENVQKFITRLVKAEYVVKHGRYAGGRRGSAQAYRLINNIGPTMPVLAIGRAKNQLVCKNTETETQTDGETETSSAGGAA